MSLMTRTDLKCLFALLCVLGAIAFGYLLHGFLGYMTTSARGTYCRETPSPRGEDCPLDLVMATGHLLLVWTYATAIFILPFLLFVALSIVACRWAHARSTASCDT